MNVSPPVIVFSGMENGVKPPPVPHDFHAVDPDGRVIIHGPEVQQDVAAFPFLGNLDCFAVPDGQQEIGVGPPPDSADSGQKGTVILPDSGASLRPRWWPLSPGSVSNSHSPFRHSQSGRTNCGRGYSGRGIVMVSPLKTAGGNGLHNFFGHRRQGNSVCAANNAAMRVHRRLLLFLLLSLASCLALSFVFPARAAPPETVFQTGFGGPPLLTEQPLSAGPGSRTVSFPLPIEKIRGAQVDFRALIRAENVATPPQVYNGIKFMLVTEGPSGTLYPACDHLWGTFSPARKQFRATVPADAVKATLVLGLEATTGKAWFSEVSATVHARPFAGGPVTPGAVWTGHPGRAAPARGDDQPGRDGRRPACPGPRLARQSGPLAALLGDARGTL